MPKRSRRRQARQRTPALAPPSLPSPPLTCAIPGCDNAGDFSCGTCNNALCSACIVPMSRVLLCNLAKEDWEVCFSCPFCRSKVPVCTFDTLAAGEDCTLKRVLATANVRTLKLPSFCSGCNSETEVLVDHVACGDGCYGCKHSKIDWVMKR